MRPRLTGMCAAVSMESGAEVVSTEIDQINSFGGAQCVDKTPFISYTLYGEWDAIEDIGDLDSISVTYGSSGISTSYSRSYKKSVTPSALLYSGFRTSGSQNIINLSPNFNRFSTRFKNAAYSRGISWLDATGMSHCSMRSRRTLGKLVLDR